MYLEVGKCINRRISFGSSEKGGSGCVWWRGSDTPPLYYVHIAFPEGIGFLNPNHGIDSTFRVYIEFFKTKIYTIEINNTDR